MINHVTNNNPATAASATQGAGQANKILCHTPFGDVLVDALSTPDIQAEFGRHASTGCTSGSQTTATSDKAAADETTDKGSAPSRSSTGETASSSGAATASVTTPTTQTPDPGSVPTPQTAFGDDPWLANPTGSGDKGYTWQFNPIYFATAQTAATIAGLVGGTVVQTMAMLGPADGPYKQDQPNQMVELANGALINPGLVADFYNHGYSQARVEQMIQEEIQGVSK